MGIPEMEQFWNDLQSRTKSGTASKSELRLFKQIGNALKHLADDPKYPGLHSHDIDALTGRYQTKVWCSYLQNKTPSAGRLYWVYGPDKNDITIIAIEPHPDDKSSSYEKIILSRFNEIDTRENGIKYK
jgi:hypothetical protein